MMISPDYARALMIDVTQSVWIEEDVSALSRFFHEDASIGGILPGTDLTVEDYTVLVQQVMLLLRVESFTISDCICDADGRVAYRMELQTTATATGATAPQEFANFCQFREDRVLRSDVLTDQMSFFERAGMICPSTRLTLLSGDQLA